MWLSGDPAAWAGICDENVVLVQPLLPPIRGRIEAEKRFARLFRHLPDFRVRLIRSGRAEDSLLVEYVAAATVGGKHISWRGVDRIAVRDGQIAHRVAYFDWVSVLLQIVIRPAAWLAAIRAGMRPRTLRPREFPMP